MPGSTITDSCSEASATSDPNDTVRCSDYGRRALLRPRPFRWGSATSPNSGVWNSTRRPPRFSERATVRCGWPCTRGAKMGTKGTAGSNVHFPRRPAYFNTCIFSLNSTAKGAQRLNEQLRGKTSTNSEREVSSTLSLTHITGSDGRVLRIRDPQCSLMSGRFAAS